MIPSFPVTKMQCPHFIKYAIPFLTTTFGIFHIVSVRKDQLLPTEEPRMMRCVTITHRQILIVSLPKTGYDVTRMQGTLAPVSPTSTNMAMVNLLLVRFNELTSGLRTSRGQGSQLWKHYRTTVENNAIIFTWLGQGTQSVVENFTDQFDEIKFRGSYNSRAKFLVVVAWQVCRTLDFWHGKWRMSCGTITRLWTLFFTS